MTNYCQESVQGSSSIDLRYKVLGIDIFSEIEILYKTIIDKNYSLNNKEELLVNNNIGNVSKYLEVIKLVRKYFDN